MKIRNLIASAGLALAMSCAPATKQVEEPRPEPAPAAQAETPRENIEVKYFVSGYEIVLTDGNYRNTAAYNHYQGKSMYSCLTLNGEGRDWVKVCSENLEGTVNSVSNFTTFHMCKYDNNGKAVENEMDGYETCTQQVYKDAQSLFNRWKARLDVDRHHKLWLNKRTKPLDGWK